MSIQDAETLQLLISTAITAQDKREWASGQENNVIGERGRGIELANGFSYLLPRSVRSGGPSLLQGRFWVRFFFLFFF